MCQDAHRRPRLPTFVAQGQLLLVTPLVVPPARVRGPLDVDLHAVLILLFVVRLPRSPVLGFFGQRLLGPHPGPRAVDLPESDPVVTGGKAEFGVQVFNLLLVLNGDQMRVPLLTISPGLLEGHAFRGGAVRPRGTVSEQEKRCGGTGRGREVSPAGPTLLNGTSLAVYRVAQRPLG